MFVCFLSPVLCCIDDTMTANMGAFVVAGIGALVKAVRPTGATSYDLSHVTKLHIETTLIGM